MPNHVSVIGSAKFPALQKKNDDVSPLFLFFGLSGQSAIIICDSRIELRVLNLFSLIGLERYGSGLSWNLRCVLFKRQRAVFEYAWAAFKENGRK